MQPKGVAGYTSLLAKVSHAFFVPHYFSKVTRSNGRFGKELFLRNASRQSSLRSPSSSYRSAEKSWRSQLILGYQSVLSRSVG